MNLNIALAIIIRFLSISVTELPMINAGNIAIPQIVPVSYRRLGLGLRPLQKCITCAQNTMRNTYLSRSGQNGVTQIYKIFKQTSTEKTFYRRFYDADEPNIVLQVPVHSVTANKTKVGKNPQQNLTNLKNRQISINWKSSIIPQTATGSDLILNKLTSFDEIYTKPITKLAADSSMSNKNDLDIFSSLDDISLANALEKFESRLYKINFAKFSALSPTPNGGSGMSFVQSGLFLALALVALSAEVDPGTKKEIEDMFGTTAPVLNLDKIKLTRRVIGSLPESREGLRFRWSTHLVLAQGREVSDQFKAGAAAALQLKIDHFERNQTPAAMAAFLNRMIEEDSGSIRETFVESDLMDNEKAVLITTLYFRARWRSPPTLLNGTWRFRDTQDIPTRTVRMIRINDVMNYMDIPEWDAEAVEIPYSMQGLTLLMLVPRGSSLKPLVEHVTGANLASLLHGMKPMRIAVRIPLYTLRMTLLLPNKLEAMGISRLVNASGATDSSLRLSQAVQRIMFWSEAGRNAFKDDGLEWDVKPDKKMVVDRPYIFYVRWHNLTIMNGNFVL